MAICTSEGVALARFEMRFCMMCHTKSIYNFACILTVSIPIDIFIHWEDPLEMVCIVMEYKPRPLHLIEKSIHLSSQQIEPLSVGYRINCVLKVPTFLSEILLECRNIHVLIRKFVVRGREDV